MNIDITITDEDRLEWLEKKVPRWTGLTQEERDHVLEDSRVNGMRAAIRNEMMRTFKWGPPGVSSKTYA